MTAEIIVFTRSNGSKDVKVGQSQFQINVLKCLRHVDEHDWLILPISNVGVLYLDLSWNPKGYVIVCSA